MKLEYYQNIAQKVIENDDKRNMLFDKIDQSINGGGELPPAIRKLPWMVHFKSTSIHDAFAAARKTIAASLLSVDVLPPIANPPTMMEAKKIEDVLEYGWWQLNRRSAMRPISQIADSTARYLAVAYEVVDNEHEYKGQSGPRIKAIKNAGRYTWKFSNVRNNHPRFSDSIMEDHLLAQTFSIQEIVDRYGEEETQKIVDEVMKGGSEREKGVLLRKTYGTLYDFYDYDNRAVWFSLAGGKNIDKTGGGNKAFKIMIEKNKLGFIPRVYSYDDDPILKAAVETNQLEQLNILLSMRYALIAATVAQARSWSKTVSGEGVNVDYGNPDAQVQLKMNEEFGNTQPAQTDPNLNNIINESRSEISNSTSVSRILSAMDTMAGGTPYSTISALQQSALQSLIEIRQVGEKAIEDGFCHQLYWAKYTKKPIYGQKLRKTGMYDETMAMGAQVAVVPQEADEYPGDWKITVQLKPNNQTDRQERLNFAINAQKQLFISRNSAFEKAGIEDDPEVSLLEYADDQMKIAQIQADAKRILMAPDLEMIEAQMKLQQKQAQAQQPQQPPPADPMGQTPATGGLPSAMQDPSATRENITGETVSGLGAS